MENQRLVLTITFLVLISNIFAQDLITLKSGDDLEVKVIEIDESEIRYRKYSNLDGPIYSIAKSKIFRIKFENGDLEVMAQPVEQTTNTVTHDPERPVLEEYGGKSAFGIELGGGGLLGLIGRYEVAPNLFVEAGLHYRPIVLLDNTDDISIKGSILLAGGVTYTISKKYKPSKRKVKFNGVFLKTGHGFSSFTENFIATGWHHESFRLGRKFKSIQFELGPGLLLSPWVNNNKHRNYRNNVSESSFMIYWKISWNFIK